MEIVIAAQKIHPFRSIIIHNIGSKTVGDVAMRIELKIIGKQNLFKTFREYKLRATVGAFETPLKSLVDFSFDEEWSFLRTDHRHWSDDLKPPVNRNPVAIYNIGSMSIQDR